jgi:hypothetical protein
LAAITTLNTYGHLPNEDLTHVGDVLGKSIEATAVSLQYFELSSTSDAGENRA